MTDPETPNPVQLIVSKPPVVLWIIAAGIVILLVLTVINTFAPSRQDSEIKELKEDAINTVDSLTKEIRKTRRENDSLEYIAAYVDSSQAYIAKLEHRIAEREVNRKETKKVSEEKKKAIANETDLESIDEIKKTLNKRK